MRVEVWSKVQQSSRTGTVEAEGDGCDRGMRARESSVQRRLPAVNWVGGGSWKEYGGFACGKEGSAMGRKESGEE